MQKYEIDDQESMDKKSAKAQDLTDAECAIVFGKGPFTSKQLVIFKNLYIADTVVDEDGKETTIMVHT